MKTNKDIFKFLETERAKLSLNKTRFAMLCGASVTAYTAWGISSKPNLDSLVTMQINGIDLIGFLTNEK